MVTSPGLIPGAFGLALAAVSVIRVMAGANAHPEALAEAVAVRLAVGDLDGADKVVGLAPRAPVARVASAIVAAAREGASPDGAAASALAQARADLDALKPIRGFSVTLSLLALADGWWHGASWGVGLMAASAFFGWGLAWLLAVKAYEGAVAQTAVMARAAASTGRPDPRPPASGS